MYFATLLTLALSTIVADCQNLHGWRQSVFAIGAERTVDGNPETYWQGGVPTTIMLLLSRAENYKGFYIQSSWPYITDYVVEGYSSSQGVTIIGQVTAARSNFTVVNFYNSAEEPRAWAEWFQITVTGVYDSHLGIYRNTTNGTKTIINEIYPIYDDEEVVYPPGHAPQPSPTQTYHPVITQTSIASHPDVSLNLWPNDAVRHPDIWGGYNGHYVADGDPDTSNYQALSDGGYPAQLYVSFDLFLEYAGLYVLSDLRDYHITGRNMKTGEDYEVCRVSGATSDLSICLFTNEAGQPKYKTDLFIIRPTALRDDRRTYFEISEIYAIYPGDKVVE